MGRTARRPWVTERGLVTGLQKVAVCRHPFILEVMKILEQEIALREETRAKNKLVRHSSPTSTRSGFCRWPKPKVNWLMRVKVVSDLRELPEGAEKFGKEIALLTRVEQVMHEATGLLERPETGPETIAAETEAIELLLQAKRINPKAGGGGGSSPGGGGTGTTEQSALALLGSGDERNSTVADRNVSQATGVSGSQLPAEFRGGLDAYFGALEALCESTN